MVSEVLYFMGRAFYGSQERNDFIMYTKDKSQRITLRLNEEQFMFVKMNADALDVSPSEFLRMVVNSSMVSFRKFQEDDKALARLSEITKESVDDLRKVVGEGRENDKTDQHNLV